jgi:hypothetical protein
MSRFKIISISIVVIVFTVGLFIWQYIASFHSVDFTITSGLSAKIYKVVDKVNQEPAISTVSSSSAIQLQNGDFCAVPASTRYDNTPVCFTVSNKNIAITVQPSYSTNYLTQLLPSQLSAINIVINNKYSAVINGFTLQTGQLFNHGEWYGTTLTQKVENQGDQGDVYRVLLKNINNTWTTVAYPQIVLSKYSYPNVPYEILDAINRLPGLQA